MAGEISVSGNFSYGFVWNLMNLSPTTDIPTIAGTWRITFSLYPTNADAVAAALALTGTAVLASANHVSIDTSTNGVIMSLTEVYIDVVVH